jgi:hypothetical protein
MILQPKVHAKSKIAVIGALAVPVLKCTFGVIN